jgi:predicted amidohydrolase
VSEEFSTTADGLGEVEDPNGIKIAVAQFGPGPNPADNVSVIGEMVRAAANNGARLIVLPEYAQALAGAMGDWVGSFAESLAGPFVEAMAELADECNIAIVVGMLEKSDNADARPFNTAIAVLPGAGLVARYRKVHLYDAYSVTESDWLQAGDPAEEPQLFFIDDLTVGLQTCFDLRFPETTRRLVDAGAQLIAMGAQWVPGPKKAHHWVALNAARAIENLVYIAAADQIAPLAVGMSRVVSPLGETLIDMGQAMGVSIATVSVEAVNDARRNNPSLSLRRFGIDPR